MKYLGFNPFIRCEKTKNNAVIYDLLNDEKYFVDKEISYAFNGKRYKHIDQINKTLKDNFNSSEIRSIIKEGKRAGLIVETQKPYYKEELVSRFETAIKKGEAIFAIRKVFIQPTGICDMSCELCKKYMNCVCVKKMKSSGQKLI